MELMNVKQEISELDELISYEESDVARYAKIEDKILDRRHKWLQCDYQALVEYRDVLAYYEKIKIRRALLQRELNDLKCKRSNRKFKKSALDTIPEETTDEPDPKRQRVD